MSRNSRLQTHLKVESGIIKCCLVTKLLLILANSITLSLNSSEYLTIFLLPGFVIPASLIQRYTVDSLKNVKIFSDRYWGYFMNLPKMKGSWDISNRHVWLDALQDFALCILRIICPPPQGSVIFIWIHPKVFSLAHLLASELEL